MGKRGPQPIYKPETELSESEVRALYEQLRSYYLSRQAKHKKWCEVNKEKRLAWLKRWKEKKETTL